eukprot:TRINITY_DN12328_c0_g1_i1.p1 TRINITY_DN12328_c0_g1~~TRINITY_DN12328_c0_g1_i1.p1  ORF type:complete len:389 (+),score=61.71 TRINITY_DN12328_c0_g1_i1:42-1208(+)
MYFTACRVPASLQLPASGFHLALTGKSRSAPGSSPRSSFAQGLAAPALLLCTLVSHRRWSVHRLSMKALKERTKEANMLRCDDEARAQLVAWAESQGIQISPKMKILVQTPSGRGCVATDSLRRGEALISGTLDSALVEKEGSAPPRPEWASFWSKWPEPEMRLSARLVAGALEGHLASYFALLPYSHDELSGSMNEASARGLSATLSRNIATREALSARGASDLSEVGVDCSPQEFSTALNAAYNRAFKLDYEVHSETWEELTTRRVLLLTICAATCAVVASVLQSAGGTVQVGAAILLGLTLGGCIGPALAAEPPSTKSCLALLPLADSLNHGSAPLDVWYDKPADYWVLRAGRDFAAGEEVVYNYGKDSDQLLLDYGITEGNIGN